MGYEINSRYCVASIPAKNFDKALAVLQGLPDDVRFGWVDGPANKITDLAELFSNIGFEVRVDSADGELHLEYFTGKTGSEEKVLSLLCPFFRPNDCIEWSGEEGEFWRVNLGGDVMLVADGFVGYGAPYPSVLSSTNY